jgi:hypothetical protein
MPTKEEYHKIFDSFNNQKILIIGDVMVDSYLWGTVERISPEAPVPVVSVKKRANRMIIFQYKAFIKVQNGLQQQNSELSEIILKCLE